VLRPLAANALAQFGVQPASFRLVNFGYNCTYKVVDQSGQAFALRINLSSKKSSSNLRAEVQWLRALTEQTDLRVPHPVLTAAGREFAEVNLPGAETPTSAVLFRWLEGHTIPEEPTKAQLGAMGAALATMHEFADTWRPTGEAQVQTISDPMQGTPNHIFGGDERLTPELLKLVHASLEKIDAVFERLKRSEQPKPIHADLHSGNALWNKGELSVIDFDDAGMGFELQDLAISIFYMRENTEKEKVFLEGYRRIRELPSFEQHELEALLASRNILLLSDLLVTTNAELIEFLPTYIERTKLRLENYLKTGQYLLVK
jgi:Ser/Thr protein kinase RdoA (MazF antagonist)